MTSEEKKERNRAQNKSKKAERAASKVKAADGSEAEPPPDAHPNKREPKGRKFQVKQFGPPALLVASILL